MCGGHERLVGLNGIFVHSDFSTEGHNRGVGECICMYYKKKITCVVFSLQTDRSSVIYMGSGCQMSLDESIATLEDTVFVVDAPTSVCIP